MSDIEEDIMNEEVFNELIDNFEIVGTLTEYGRKAIKQNVKKLQKRIKELEEKRQLVGMPVKNKRDGRIGVVLHQWESGSVAVLENINPRVINTHDNWSTLEILTDEVKQTQTKCDSIPVQKVKKKIEEVHNMKFEDERLNSATIDFAVHKFEELLEEKQLWDLY